MATSYPFPDNIHVTSSVTIKLNNTNYLLWKSQFESLLSCQKLIGFVNGAVTAPPRTSLTTNGEEVPNPQYEAWFCTDQLIRSWIFGTLSEEVLGYVHNVNTFREVWISLAENFNKSSIAREFTLRRSMWVLEKKDLLMVTSSQAIQGGRNVYIVYMGALSPNSDYATVRRHHYSLLHSDLGKRLNNYFISRSRVPGYLPSLIVDNFGLAFDGFTALLTEEESKKLSVMPEVVSVFPNRKLILHKDIDADSVIDWRLKTQQHLAPL